MRLVARQFRISTRIVTGSFSATKWFRCLLQSKFMEKNNRMETFTLLYLKIWITFVIAHLSSEFKLISNHLTIEYIKCKAWYLYIFSQVYFYHDSLYEWCRLGLDRKPISIFLSDFHRERERRQGRCHCALERRNRVSWLDGRPFRGSASNSSAMLFSRR